MPQPLGTMSYTSMPAAGRSSHIVAVNDCQDPDRQEPLTNQGAPYSGRCARGAGARGFALRPLAALSAECRGPGPGARASRARASAGPGN
jgi:hypothetical protein